MHGEKFVNWLEEKAMEAIRDGQTEVVVNLHKANSVNAMRRLVKEDDVPRLLRIVQESPEPGIRILAVSVLANYENTREVQTVFLDRWRLLKDGVRTDRGSRA